MIRRLIKLPRPPIDIVITVAALVLALAAGRVLLTTARPHDVWVDIFFLGSVTLFLLGAVCCLVRTFDIERDMDELPVVQHRSSSESDAARK